MHYHIFPTAFGYGGILFQRNPLSCKQIYLPHSSKSLIKKRIQATTYATHTHTQEILDLCQDIQAYFEGTPIIAPWKLLDLSGLTPLQQSVLETVAAVAYGTTRTYSEISAQIGRPKACRFVGMTLARNPFPVVIPCHRIVRANGSPGGFAGGEELKRRMLALEREP